MPVSGAHVLGGHEYTYVPSSPELLFEQRCTRGRRVRVFTSINEDLLDLRSDCRTNLASLFSKTGNMNSSLERTNFLSLQLFLAIVEKGSIAEAARQSFIAPTAVTKRMQELEDDFGVTLLVRTSKGVLPTAAGSALAQHVRAMTNLSERMHTEMKDYAEGARGHVRLVANASALVENLAEEVARYMSSHPNIRIDLEAAHSGDVIRAVRDGNADIGVFAPPAIADSGLDVRQYRRDRLAVAVPLDPFRYTQVPRA